MCWVYHDFGMGIWAEMLTEKVLSGKSHNHALSFILNILGIILVFVLGRWLLSLLGFEGLESSLGAIKSSFSFM